MPRQIWKGVITFGMISIPVGLYAATESKDVRLRLLHKEDGAPIAEEEVRAAGWDRSDYAPP